MDAGTDAGKVRRPRIPPETCPTPEAPAFATVHQSTPDLLASLEAKGPYARLVDILVATTDGIHPVGAGDAARAPRGVDMTALAVGSDGLWAIGDSSTIWHHPMAGDGHVVAQIEGRATCLLPTSDGGVWIGAARAAMFRLQQHGVERVEAFDRVPGREAWYTPWGGPPDVRSLAQGGDGTLYANVHVGGVVVSHDGGETWTDSMDIDNDVHEVTGHPTRDNEAYVAAAVGLGVTRDSGGTWEFFDTGLHGRYCRAVAVAGDTVFVSASLGSSGARAALYRVPASLGEPAEQCRNGLPEWFSTNLDTFCVAVQGSNVVAADADGTVYLSTNEGDSWSVVERELPGPRAVLIVGDA